jgi:hypothetical protein
MGSIQDTRDGMLEQAVRTLMWSEGTEHGQSLDCLYDVEHIAQKTVDTLREDIYNFIDLIIDLEDEEMSKHAWAILRNDPLQAGHDFILSRNGHGSGFWDRGTGNVGDELHKWAKTFGTFSLYVGDDGYLYN